MRKILFHTTFLSILFVCVSLPAYAQMKIGDSPTTITTGSQLDIEKGGSHTVFMDTGSVGIGDVSPASMLTVGSGDLFQVDSAGNIVKIRNVTTSFPSSQGGVGTVLTNDGSGTLTWTAPASSITADSLNFTDLSDSLVLDASTDISVTGSNVLSVTNSGSGLSFRVNDDTTSDTTPFVIDASGNVGIGTAAPTSKLVTIGDVNMEGVLKLWDRYTLQSNGTVLQVGGSASYTDMGLYTGGAEKVRINSSGNVGIGTTGPGVKLDISQAGDGNQIRFETTGGSGAGRMWTLSAWNSTPSNHFSIDESGIGQRLSLFPNGGISLGSYTTTAAPANGMIISGNVGIGTTSPTGSLEIAKSASGTIGPILSLVNSASLASGNGVDIAMAGNPGGSASAPTGRIRLTEGASAASTMSFWTYAGSGSLAERMRIDSNGNVGIGTTSPDSKLNVNGLLKLDMTGGDPTMQFRGAGDSYFLKWISASNILTFQNSSGVNQLSLNSGNVGIGTIAPGQKLSVIGTSYFSGYLGIGSTTGAGAEGSTMRIAKDNAVQGGGQLIINGSTDQTKRIMTGYNTTSDYGQIQAMNNLTAVPIALNPNGGNVGIGTTTPAYLLDVAGIGNFRDLITQDLTLSGASTSILSGYKGVDGYTNFSGGIGTGGNGKDSITSAQRLTSSGNLVNIGSYLGGEMLLTKSGTFAAKADYGTGTSPRSVAIGDLNGDGKADLAVANQDSATVSVFLNNGNGTFAAKADYVAGTSPRSVAIGDLNGDGKADLVVASQESTTISVFLNNGNGTFAAKADYATGTNPETVSIGDLNGDGKADLAVANYSDNTVSVFLNNGNGTFAAKADYG
ncbi:MAG: VCBS repeat-containing protein, partial [Candidatus Roizmanbacteria bacterium]